jgi:hypothetical protein
VAVGDAHAQRARADAEPQRGLERRRLAVDPRRHGFVAVDVERLDGPLVPRATVAVR